MTMLSAPTAASLSVLDDLTPDELRQAIKMLYVVYRELRARVALLEAGHKELRDAVEALHWADLGLARADDEQRAAFNSLLSLDTFRPYAQPIGKLEADDATALP